MLNVSFGVCAYFVQLSHNTLTNIGALTLLRSVKNNMTSAVEEIDISVSAAKTVFISACELKYKYGSCLYVTV